MKKNIILVTGGAGFIGSRLIEYLIKIKIKEKIISLDNYSSGYKRNHITNSKVKYIKGNNKNINEILKKYRKKIKIIFHFGEYSRIFQSFKNYKKCFEYNIYHSSKVIEFAKDNKIKIIYSATSASFGNKMSDQHLSPYVFTKTKNLHMILNFHNWFGLKYEIIYFYNVYGPREIKNHKMAAVIGIFRYCS